MIYSYNLLPEFNEARDEIRAKDGPMDKEKLLDFIENRLNIKLLNYQKDLIMKLPISKKELYILYGRKGNIYIGEKEKENEN